MSKELFMSRCLIIIIILIIVLSIFVFVLRSRNKEPFREFEPLVIKNVLSNQEIEHIKQSAKYTESGTIGQSENKPDHSHRISETAWYENNELVDRLARKVDPSKDRRYCEKIQVVRYKKGGFFNPHNDSIENPHSNFNYDFKHGGHRLYTLLIALSHPHEYDGGETIFPNLKQKFKLNRGDGLLFRNVDEKGRLINKSLHGGSPVVSGEKIICNLWIHVLPYKSF